MTIHIKETTNVTANIANASILFHSTSNHICHKMLLKIILRCKFLIGSARRLLETLDQTNAFKMEGEIDRPEIQGKQIF